MSRKIDTDFGERLRQAAEKVGVPYSQSAIGAYLGVRKQNVDSWMNGALPRADQLFAIADKLKVDPRWLATGEQTHKENGIPDVKLKKILAVVKTLLDTDHEGVSQIAAAAEGVTEDHGAAGNGNQRSRNRRTTRS